MQTPEQYHCNFRRLSDARVGVTALPIHPDALMNLLSQHDSTSRGDAARFVPTGSYEVTGAASSSKNPAAAIDRCANSTSSRRCECFHRQA